MTKKFTYVPATGEKILAVLTEEWQPCTDIAHWCEIYHRTVRKYLKYHTENGTIEQMWDGYLGIHYWRRLK